VSILSEPEPILGSPEERRSAVSIGRDGLIIESGRSSGLLLPIVPVEYCWDVNEFLSQLCYKAGLEGGAWSRSDARLYRFETQVFAESSPGGPVTELDPSKAPRRKE
jgi:uncharacterized protein (TIGR00296 family)